MSDKETAPWMKEAAESIALAALRCRTFQMPTRIAEIIAAHCPVAVECRAPAPQPTKEEAEIAVDKMFNTWLSRHCFFYANKTLRASGWREIAISLYRRAATPQVTPELELEQEADGRWLAAYTRFPGVAAYGPSKEEAIWNAAKVLIDSEPADTIDDGFGNSWSAYCPTCKQKSMYVSRPGDARCSTCESKQSHEFKPYMEDHEYYDPPQASPTPDK